MSAFVLAALLAVESPTIAVDIDALALPNAQAEQLHGELMTRLVESGHPVGTSGAIVVRLTGGGARVHVEVQHGTRAWQRDVDGSGALLRLATIHAVLDLLAQVDAVEDPDPARASPAERSVFVEADATASAWMPEVIAALVDADNVVKPSREGAGWRVCVGAAESLPTIAVAPIDAPCPAGTPSEGLAEDLVIALAGARAAPREPAVVVPTEPAPPESEPEPAPKPVAATPRPARREQAWSGAIGVGAGAQGRFEPAEALVLVHGDARHDSGAMLTLRTELAPSAAGEGWVVDTFVTAGAGYAFTPRPRLRLELVATAGVLVHGYDIAGDSDSRTDFTAALPITFAIRLAPRVELGLSLVAGVSTRPRSHLQGDDSLWSRDRFRLAGLVGLRFLLGRKLGTGKMAGGT